MTILRASSTYTLLAMAVALVAGCAGPGESKTGIIGVGQWSPAQPIGPDRFMVQGFETRDAVKGATEFCARSDRMISTERIETHTEREIATVLFRCVAK